LAALVFGAGFFVEAVRETTRKAPGYRRAVSTFKTHYAREGLIVSKCGCMDVKRLAAIWQSRRRSDVIVQRLL
jgi:hypothetical protein